MSTDLARLLEDAMKLPEADRADLAACLWASLPTTDEAPLDAEWQAEIGRRLDTIDQGTASWVVDHGASLANPRRSCFVFDATPQDADPLDLGFHHVLRLEIDRWPATVADAGGRAGHQQVARFERREGRKDRDDRRHGKDHLRRIG